MLRVRRRMWLRRVTLPAATVVGLLVSFKPLTQLVTAMAGLTQLLPLDKVGGSAELILQQLPMLVLGGMLLGAFMLGLRIIED